jgi:hypothetical protein
MDFQIPKTEAAGQTFLGLNIREGLCGNVDLSGLKCAALLEWPTAIHEGNGQCVLVVERTITESQMEALCQILTGKLGGMPWELLSNMFELKSLIRADIRIEGAGLKTLFRVEGIGEAQGDTLKNPVTGQDHFVNLEMPTGFLWTKGQCGQGSFQASAAGISVGGDKSDWVLYSFDWAKGQSPL